MKDHMTGSHTVLRYTIIVFQGQIHFNKKDMDLKAGENADYDSYGDTQGDPHWKVPYMDCLQQLISTDRIPREPKMEV